MTHRAGLRQTRRENAPTPPRAAPRHRPAGQRAGTHCANPWPRFAAAGPLHRDNAGQPTRRPTPPATADPRDPRGPYSLAPGLQRTAPAPSPPHPPTARVLPGRPGSFRSRAVRPPGYNCERRSRHGNSAGCWRRRPPLQAQAWHCPGPAQVRAVPIATVHLAGDGSSQHAHLLLPSE